MNAVIYLSTSKKRECEKISKSIQGDHIEIVPKRRFKTRFMQMFMYGYYTTQNKNVAYQANDINFELYDHIYLVSPVWAGRVAQYMKLFLQKNKFQNKKIHVIANCDGGYTKYFSTVRKELDDSNEIVEERMFIKGLEIEIK